MTRRASAPLEEGKVVMWGAIFYVRENGDVDYRDPSEGGRQVPIGTVRVGTNN